jgi:hypothetical protein
MKIDNSKIVSLEQIKDPMEQLSPPPELAKKVLSRNDYARYLRKHQEMVEEL